jgi:hypothetical protein
MGRLYETMVCEAHAAALESGERYIYKRYAYNSLENVTYMGRMHRLETNEEPQGRPHSPRSGIMTPEPEL